MDEKWMAAVRAAVEKYSDYTPGAHCVAEIVAAVRANSPTAAPTAPVSQPYTDRADQAGFEKWARSHGEIFLELAAEMRCENGWFPATYWSGRAEIAWRAWANGRVSVAPVSQPAAQEQKQAAREAAARKALSMEGEALHCIGPLSVLPEEKPTGQVYGIIDPDYGRIYTMVRKLAWEEGYAIGLHGSFTRDLDMIAVPWEGGRRCNPEKLVARILQATGLREASGNPGEKPHGRKVWTLLLPEFGDPRFVDLSIMPLPAAPQPITAPAGSEQAYTADEIGLAAADVGISDSKYEALCTALAAQQKNGRQE